MTTVRTKAELVAVMLAHRCDRNWEGHDWQGHNEAAEARVEAAWVWRAAISFGVAL